MNRRTNAVCIVASLLQAASLLGLAPAARALTGQNIKDMLTDCLSGSGPCAIELACETYNIDVASSGTALAVFAPQVWIRGCGDTTVLSYSADMNTQAQGSQTVVGVSAQVQNFRISDLKIVVNEQCVGCRHKKLVPISIASSGSSVIENVTIETNITLSGPQAHGVRATDAANVRVTGSRFLHAGATNGEQSGDVPGAVHFTRCDACSVDSSLFRYNHPPGLEGGWNAALIHKGEGDGVRITNNTFDLESRCDNPPCIVSGVRLSGGHHTVVSANTFWNFPRDFDSIGVWLYSYRHATITSNSFVAGGRTCSETATTACSVDEECPAGEVCVGTLATGVAFNDTQTPNVNRYNTISANMFNRFLSDQPNSCPIRLGAGGSGGGETSIRNIITSNHFAIAGDPAEPPVFAPDDGICGQTSKLGQNTVDDNFTH
jgi:hypothetical protein